MYRGSKAAVLISPRALCVSIDVLTLQRLVLRRGITVTKYLVCRGDSSRHFPVKHSSCLRAPDSESTRAAAM